MTQPIQRLSKATKNYTVHSRAFKNMIEDHLEIISAASANVLAVTDAQAIRCRYDFYALLTELKVMPDKHWITMRLNGFESPDQYTGNLIGVKVPATDVISTLTRRFKAQSAIF